MLNVDQFIYTAASIQGKRGYQVVAKSKGISNQLLLELDPYLYPLGITQSGFIESRSLLLLEHGKISYSKVKNSGIGYDGRSNTLYNHTLVLSIDDFKEIANDTRVLEKYYVEDSTLEGELPQLKIEPEHFTKNFLLMDETKDYLHEILSALFNKSKIAILQTENPELIQNTLSLVPPSMRLVSFSTMVVQPDLQPNYHFILTGETSQSLLEKKYRIIDPELLSKNEHEKAPFDDSIDYFINLLNSQQVDKIKQFHDQFESLSGDDFRTKVTLLSYLGKLEQSSDKSEQQDFSNIIIELLTKFEPKSVFPIYNKIKDLLSSNKIQKYAGEFEIPQILSNFESIPIEKEIIEKMLSQLSDGTSDSRHKLLTKLVEKQKEDFIRNGSSLIIQAKNSYYNSEIYRVFVENDFLHKCIFETLDEKNQIKDYHKKEIFTLFFTLSSKYSMELISSLLNYDVFSLEDSFEATDFQNLVKKSLGSDSIRSLDTNILFTVSKKLFSKIKKPTEITKTSGTMELPNSVLKPLVKIAKIIQESLDFILQNRKLNNKQKKEILQLNKQVEHFIEEKKINESSIFKPFWFFRN